VVRIKRLFSILIITALLFGFSSCGTKGSSNTLKIDFSEITCVMVKYKGVDYSCDLSFNGNVLYLKACNSISGISVIFTVDSLTCTIAQGKLKKVYETEKLSETFLPIKLFSFFNSNGVILEFKRNSKTKEAYFDSFVNEPYVYIDSNKNIVFEIK
jgi:hypothetical protein